MPKAPAVRTLTKIDTYSIWHIEGGSFGLQCSLYYFRQHSGGSARRYISSVAPPASPGSQVSFLKMLNDLDRGIKRRCMEHRRHPLNKLG